MKKFINVFNFRILFFLLVGLFILNCSVYGLDISKKFHLRPPLLNNSEYGKEELRAGLRVLTGHKKEWRHLRAKEITDLRKRGCLADDWNYVIVGAEFSTDNIGYSVRFKGKVYIEGGDGTYITDSMVSNSSIAAGVNIREGCMIEYSKIGKGSELRHSIVQGRTEAGVTIEESVKLINSYVYTEIEENDRATWVDYSPALTGGYISGRPTIVYRYTHIEDSFIVNSIVGKESIIRGAYLEMAELLDKTWVYPNARIVLAKVGGKIKLDMCSLSESSLLYLSEGVGFHASVGVDELEIGGETIKYPVPIVNLGGSIPNTNGELNSDLQLYEKGVPFMSAGVIIEKGSMVYGVPTAKPSNKSSLIKNPIGTYLGPCVRIKSSARAIGAIPPFTLVNGMSISEWDIGAILNDEPELIVSTIYTMIQHMNKTGNLHEIWTESHNEIVNQWISDGLVLIEKLMAQLRDASDPKSLRKKEILIKGKERLSSHLRKWSMEFSNTDSIPHFVDTEKQKLLERAVELDEYATGFKWESPLTIKSDKDNIAHIDSRLYMDTILKDDMALLSPDKIEEMRRNDIYIDGTVFVEKGYDLKNLKPGAKLSGTVFLLKGAVIEGEVSNSLISGGYVYQGAVILGSVIRDSNIKGEVLFSSVSNTTIKNGSHVIGSELIETDMGIDIEVAHCRLKGAELWPYVILHDVKAEKQLSSTGKAIRSFSLPNVDEILASVEGQMPKGALIAYKKAIEKTFERACSYGALTMAVDRMIFGPGVKGYCSSGIKNSIIGLGSEIRGASLMNNVVVHEDCDVRFGADVEDCILERGSVVGAIVKRSVIAGNVAHTISNVEDAFILLWAPCFIPKGAILPEKFEVVFESEQGSYGVFSLEGSKNNIAGHCRVRKVVCIDAFLAAGGNIEGKEGFRICGFNSFVTGDSGDNLLLPLSSEPFSSNQEPQHIFGEALNPGRIINRMVADLSANANYGIPIKASIFLTMDILNFQRSLNIGLNIDTGIKVGKELIQSGRLDVVRQNGLLTFKYPFRRAGSRWVNDAIGASVEKERESLFKEGLENGDLSFRAVLVDKFLMGAIPVIPANNVPRYIASLINRLFLSNGQEFDKKPLLFIDSRKGQSEICISRDNDKIFVWLDFDSEVPLDKQIALAWERGIAIRDAESGIEIEKAVPVTIENRRHAGRELIGSVDLLGLSFHLGEKSRVKIRRRQNGKQHCFVRADIHGSVPIEVTSRNAQIRAKNTGFANADGIDALQAEHILSVLTALNVDPVEIEINGREPPILDGSAKVFARAVLKKSRETEVDKKTIVVKAPFVFMQGTSIKIIALPAEQRGELTITAIFDKSGYTRVKDFAHIRITPASFLELVAPARTTYPEWQLPRYWREGLFRGAGPQTGVSVTHDMSEGFNDELARHKILDFLGDMAALKMPLEGHFIILGTGHRDHIGFAKRLGGWIEEGEGVYAHNGICSNITSASLLEIALREIVTSGRLPDFIIDRIKKVFPHTIASDFSFPADHIADLILEAQEHLDQI